MKGHKLTSPQGCPIRKFEPIQGADYAPDRPSPKAAEIPPPGNCCGAKEDELKPMTWAEAAQHLTESMKQWRKDGYPTTPDNVYNARVSQCQEGCPHYRFFQCRLCKCLVFTKAKVPNEQCPADRWEKL